MLLCLLKSKVLLGTGWCFLYLNLQSLRHLARIQNSKHPGHSRINRTMDGSYNTRRVINNLTDLPDVADHMHNRKKGLSDKEE